MGLSNYQLVLLDNLVYLKSIKNRFDEEKEKLEKNNDDQEVTFKEDKAGKGVTIDSIISDLMKDLEDAEQEEKEKNPEKSEILLTCDMSKQEWFGILDAIAGDDTLKNLVIHNIQDNNDDDKSNNDNGFRAMTLVGTDENIIIFRGTSTNEEWIDNGQGGYSEITNNQADALNYVNSIELVNSNPFVVSGHSKGGNLAQFVTLFSTDTLIDRCLNYDGQGFSNELLGMPEYQKALELNGDKLYMIASACEPVNILFNTAVPEDHRMYIDSSPEDNIFHYHKPNNVLAYKTVQDSNGKEMEIADRLRATAPISSLTYVLKDFVKYILDNLSDETKQIVFDDIMQIAMAVRSDDTPLVNGFEDGERLILDILADYVLPVLALKNPVWLLPYVCIKSIDVIADSVDDLMSLVECGSEKGVLRQVLNDSVAESLIDALVGYAVANPDKIAFCIIESSVLKNLPEEARAGLTDIAACNYLDIENTRAYSSTLGENYYGTEYRKVTEEGITVVRGTGESLPVYGTGGDDYLHGGNGNDIVYASDGDDMIFGGRGDDKLFGHAGNDIYVIGKYDGIDRIYDSSANHEVNCIAFGAGIAEGDLEYEQSGDSLLIHYNPEHYNDCYVEVVNFFSTGVSGKLQPPIDMISFDDNTVIRDVNYILDKVGYKGTVEKTVLDKIAEKPQEEQEKILKEYDFLQDKIDKLREEANGNTEKENQGTIGSVSRPDASGNANTSVTGSQSTKEETEVSPQEQAEYFMANVRNRVSDAANELVGKMPDKFTEATRNRYVDPIVVDLDRDGQFVTSLEDGVHFDLNGDGFAEKTAWVSRWDGLLVRDVNGNGSIDDGSELFGDQTIKKDGTVAKSGFEALAELDTNGDGILDSSDSEYDSLKIWMDFDRNGISNQNELFTLKEFGIISIDLENKIISQMDQNGNLIKSQSIMGGGDTEFHINEYGFSVDYVDTQYRGEAVDTSSLPDGLPDIKGCGTLHSLAVEMVKNEKLLDLVTAYVNEAGLPGKVRYDRRDSVCLDGS